MYCDRNATILFYKCVYVYMLPVYRQPLSSAPLTPCMFAADLAYLCECW